MLIWPHGPSQPAKLTEQSKRKWISFWQMIELSWLAMVQWKTQCKERESQMFLCQQPATSLVKHSSWAAHRFSRLVSPKDTGQLCVNLILHVPIQGSLSMLHSYCIQSSVTSAVLGLTHTAIFGWDAGVELTWQLGTGKGHHVSSLFAELCSTMVPTTHLLEFVTLYKTLIQLPHLEQHSLLCLLGCIGLSWAGHSFKEGTWY